MNDGVKALQERMKRFGLRIIRLAERIPQTGAGGLISYQLIKSGTSAGANIPQ